MRFLFLILLLALGCRSGYESLVPEGKNYFQVGGLYALELFDLKNNESDIEDALPIENANLSADNSPGFDLRYGYRFDDHVAAELQYQYFFGGDVDLKSGDMQERFGKYDAWAASANLRWYFKDRYEQDQPYVLMGFGWARFNFEDDSGLAFDKKESDMLYKFAAGWDIHIAQGAFFTMEIGYIVPLGNLQNFKMIPITAGLYFRF